jgi:nucleoside-diphosphate-sugar epimerase
MNQESRHTIAITGANGFLGSNVIMTAIQRGWTVRAIVRRSAAAKYVETLGAESFIVPELNTDELDSIVQGCDAILNFIGITSGTAQDFDRINVGSVKIILNTAIQAKIPRVVLPSGLGVEEVGKKWWANNNYFRSKLKIEEVCRSSRQEHIIFRPSYILGPGDELLPTMVQNALQGVIPIIGNGNLPFQPIFIEDAAKMFLNAAIGYGTLNTIYDLVGPEIISMEILVNRVIKIMHEIGILLGDVRIEHIPIDQAAIKLGISREDIDVTQCDVLGDTLPVVTAMQVNLTPLDTALNVAIKHACTELKIEN